MKILALLISLSFGAQYSEPTRKFTFQYDESGWDVVPAKPETQDVDKKMAEKTLVTVQRKASDEKYHARFSVVVDNLKKFPGSPAEQLVKYRQHAVDFLKGQRFHISQNETTKLPGVDEPAIELVGNQRDFGLTFKQVLFIHGGEAYLLTGATRTKQYDAHGPELKKIFDSFRFEKKK